MPFLFLIRFAIISAYKSISAILFAVIWNSRIKAKSYEYHMLLSEISLTCIQSLVTINLNNIELF